MSTTVQEWAPSGALAAAVAQAEREARRRRAPVLASATVPVPSLDPVGLFERAADQERALWGRPAEGLWLVALGVTARLTGRGRQRFAEAAAAWRHLTSRTVVEGPAAGPLRPPLCLGGFAFEPAREPDPLWDGYPDAELVVPRLLLLRLGDESWATATLEVAPGCDVGGVAEEAERGLRALFAAPPVEMDDQLPGVARIDEGGDAARWKGAVQDLVQEIRRGAVEKVVLARRVHAQLAEAPEPGAMLRRLRSRYGTCTLFAFTRRGSCFLGATPERLVRLDGDRLQATCLAGSTARGATEEEDRSLGEELLASAKERHEHALAVRALREALAPRCASLWIPERPTLLRLANVQHLSTPVEGVVEAGTEVLDLVERLHPTPAVGGVPREAALERIHKYEPFHRGWYAGPVGWVDGRGSGEFAVAIRSGLVQGTQAFLYAGCGIVAGSDPHREYEESRLKLRPMLWALNGE